MTFAPQAEHLAHMPAHVWIETGNYAAALASSERAYALFEKLKTDANRSPGHDRLEQHDVYVGYAAAMMLGNYAEAKVWSARTSSGVRPPNGRLYGITFQPLRGGVCAHRRFEVPRRCDRGLAALRLGKLDEARSLRAQLGNASGDQRPSCRDYRGPRWEADRPWKAGELVRQQLCR